MKCQPSYVADLSGARQLLQNRQLNKFGFVVSTNLDRDVQMPIPGGSLLGGLAGSNAVNIPGPINPSCYDDGSMKKIGYSLYEPLNVNDTVTLHAAAAIFSCAGGYLSADSTTVPYGRLKGQDGSTQFTEVGGHANSPWMTDVTVHFPVTLCEGPHFNDTRFGYLVNGDGTYLAPAEPVDIGGPAGDTVLFSAPQIPGFRFDGWYTTTLRGQMLDATGLEHPLVQDFMGAFRVEDFSVLFSSSPDVTWDDCVRDDVAASAGYFRFRNYFQGERELTDEELIQESIEQHGDYDINDITAPTSKRYECESVFFNTLMARYTKIVTFKFAVGDGRSAANAVPDMVVECDGTGDSGMVGGFPTTGYFVDDEHVNGNIRLSGWSGVYLTGSYGGRVVSWHELQNSKIYWRDFASVGYTVTFHSKFGINVRFPYLPGMASRAESDLPSGNGTVSGMGYVEFYETWSPDAVITQSTLDLNAGYAVAVAPLINEPLYFYPVLKGYDSSRQRSQVVAYRKSDGAAIFNRLPDSVAQVTLSVGDKAAYSDAYRILDLFETKLFVEIHCAPCIVGVAYTVDGGTAQTVAATEYTTIGPLPFGSTVSYWGTQDASGSSGGFELNASPENPATFVVGEEHIGIERVLQPVSPEEPFSVCPTSERQFEVTFDNFFRMHPVLASQLEVTGGRVVRLYDDYSSRTTRVSEYGANTFWSGFVLFSAGAGTASMTTAPSSMDWLIFRACRPGDLSLSFRVAAVALDGSSSPGYSSKANMLYSDETPFAENAPFLLRSMFDRVDANSVFEHNLEHVSVAVRFYDYDGDAIESATWLEDSETTVQGEQSFGFADVGASRLSVRVPSGAATMRMTFSVSPGYAALFGSVRLAPAMYDGDENLSVSYSAIENYQFPEAPHINLRSITDGYKFSDYFKFPTPTRPGYEFQRWISCDFGANAREFASSSSIPMRDLSLISVWRGMEIDTLFNTEGGLIYKEENGEKVINPSAFFGKVRIGETFGTLPTPERAGYIFDGWHTATEGGTRLLADSFVPFQTDTALQLYAHWTPDPDYAPPRSTKIIYHFLTDEPDATETVTGRLGGQAALHPPTPTVAKPGHAFNGWSAVSPGDQFIYGYNPNFFVDYTADATAPVIHMRAVWEQTHFLFSFFSFDPDEPTLDKYTAIEHVWCPMDVDNLNLRFATFASSGEELPDPGDWPDGSKVFKGWYLRRYQGEVDGNRSYDKVYDKFDESRRYYKNLNVWAHWSAADGGSGSGGPSSGGVVSRTYVRRWVTLYTFGKALSARFMNDRGVETCHTASDTYYRFKYYEGDTVNLPTGSDIMGLGTGESAEWYDNPEYSGEPVTQIDAHTTGDLAFYLHVAGGLPGSGGGSAATPSTTTPSPIPWITIG